MRVKQGKALVLHSGGIDSTVCLALAIRDCMEVETISATYGQKHSKEIQYAMRLASHYGIRHHLVALPEIFGGQGSTLIDRGLEQPKKTYQEILQSEGPSPTVVPNRNMNLLAIAGTIALARKCDCVYWGPHATDAHNWAYPDCSAEFIGAMANALYVGNYHSLRLRTPITWMTKEEVVKLGIELAIPFYMTWSCYEGGEKHCGVCPTCVERIAAFKANGMIDPVAYDIEIDWSK